MRLTGCNLRCVWCDTAYAFYEGREMTLDAILTDVAAYGCSLVEVTGGEPLIQPGAINLMERLLSEGYEVMLETGGSLPLNQVPREVIKIVDFKTPSSGMVQKNLWSILDDLASPDEIKFVIGDRADYDWAQARLQEYALTDHWTVLFSPVFGVMDPQTLADWMLNDRLPVRLQTQLHKQIWSPHQRGV